MTKTQAPASKGSMRLSHTGASSEAKPGVGTKSPSSVFISMAVDMSWRLALAVLVPTLIGIELDKVFKTGATLTIVGLLIAMIGMGFVLWRTLQVANRMPVPKLTAAQKRAIKKQYEEDDKDA
jgi:F0F1-type ATP synthase assembly protein I